MKRNTWEKCLEAVRTIARSGEPITSVALQALMKYPDTERSSALDIAAGWICNLRRWGYLRIKKGAKVQGPRRQLQVYELTSWGERFGVGSAKRRPHLRLAANPKKDKAED